MFPISLHSIKALGSLSRRVVEEEFLFWAKQFNDVGDYSIALKTIYRNQVSLDAAQEMWWNRDYNALTSVHEVYKHPKITSSSLPIKTAPGGNFTIDWSCNIKKVAASSVNNMVLAIRPYAGGKILWEASDRIESEWPLAIGSTVRSNQIPDDDGSHSLSGQANFSANDGEFEVGLVAVGDWAVQGWSYSQYEVRNVQIVVRRVL